MKSEEDFIKEYKPVLNGDSAAISASYVLKSTAHVVA